MNKYRDEIDQNIWPSESYLLRSERDHQILREHEWDIRQAMLARSASDYLRDYENAV